MCYMYSVVGNKCNAIKCVFKLKSFSLSNFKLKVLLHKEMWKN